MSTRVLIGFCVVLAAGSAHAQDVVFTPAQAAQAGDVVVFRGVQRERSDGGTFERRIEVIGAEPFDFAETVSGAPYSADSVTEVTQSLADGNRIERRTTSSVARDTRGRVRREQQVAAIGPLVPRDDLRVVMIIDPVAKVHYTLDEARRVATRVPMPSVARPAEMGTRALPAMPLAGAATFFTAGVAAPRDARTEQLGTRTFDGIVAEGTRTTSTIPAGEIGNQAPIEIVSERWYSPDLKVVVYSRRSDPRFGETTYRLERIVRGEPAPDLFRVPADYQLETPRPFTAPLRVEPKPQG